MNNKRSDQANPSLTSTTKKPPETMGSTSAPDWQVGASGWFQVGRGQTFDIEVLIGDGCGFFLAFSPDRRDGSRLFESEERQRQGLPGDPD